MKKKYIIVALFLLTINSYAQNTTKDEYLYMTKGLLIQLENGLDIKKGYSLRKFSKNHVDKYTFTFNLLVRDNKEEKIAGIIVHAVSKVSGRTYIKAVPFGGFNKELSPLFNEYYDSIGEWDSNMSTAYSAALTRVLSNFMINPNLTNEIIGNK